MSAMKDLTNGNIPVGEVHDYLKVFERLAAAQQLQAREVAGDVTSTWTSVSHESVEEGDEGPEFVPLATNMMIFEASSICEKLERAGVRFALQDESEAAEYSPRGLRVRGGLGTSMSIFVHPDDVEEARPIIAAVLKIIP